MGKENPRHLGNRCLKFKIGSERKKIVFRFESYESLRLFSFAEFENIFMTLLRDGDQNSYLNNHKTLFSWCIQHRFLVHQNAWRYIFDAKTSRLTRVYGKTSRRFSMKIFIGNAFFRSNERTNYEMFSIKLFTWLITIFYLQRQTSNHRNRLWCVNESLHQFDWQWPRGFYIAVDRSTVTGISRQPMGTERYRKT